MEESGKKGGGKMRKSSGTWTEIWRLPGERGKELRGDKW